MYGRSMHGVHGMHVLYSVYSQGRILTLQQHSAGRLLLQAKYD